VDEKRKSKTSPISHYPYTYTREAAGAAKTATSWDACQNGLETENSPIPRPCEFAIADNQAPSSRCLPKGFKTARYRSTDATGICRHRRQGPHQGRRPELLSGARGDLFVCRAAMGHHEADVDSVCLFSFSDRPVQQEKNNTDLLREGPRLNA